MAPPISITFPSDSEAAPATQTECEGRIPNPTHDCVQREKAYTVLHVSEIAMPPIVTSAPPRFAEVDSTVGQSGRDCQRSGY